MMGEQGKVANGYDAQEIREQYYVILINYNHAELTVDCIRSLDEAGWDRARIIVVDNASPDNSLETLWTIEGIKLIESDVNGGFSYGNNLAIRWALEQDCAGVILLNNDTVVAKDFFERIFEGTEQEVCVPKIYYYSDPDVLWMAGADFDYKIGRASVYGEKQPDAPQYSEEKYTDCACGCCEKIPRYVLDRVGLLDETFFMYREDDDYSLRLRDAGIKVHYLPQARIWHKASMSSGADSVFTIYYMNRNRFYILKKYHFGAQAWVYTLASRFVKCVVGYLIGSNDRIILRAWRDYRRGIMGKVDLS